MANAQGPIKYRVIDLASAATATMVTSVSGARTKVIGLHVNSSGNGTLTFLSVGTATATLVPAISLNNLLNVRAPNSRDGHFETAAGAALVIRKTGTATMTGWMVYQQSKVT